MKDPILFRRDDALSATDGRYWKDLLYRAVKVGIEVEVAPPKASPRPEFEADVRAALEPSGSFERLGHFGVFDVITEHAGIEVRVIGRQPYFSALHKQYTQIFRILNDKGGRPRATCGLHYHLLTPGLAEPVPEIILANLWNLVRRYAPELRFITSGGSSRDALTRHRMYCSHLEMAQHSPGNLRMIEIKHALKVSRIVPEHQNFFNLENIDFDQDGNITPFDLEFRFPDADLCPLSVTAKAFLFLALLLKAVDLSQYGVIHVGKIVDWRRKMTLLEMLNNNEGEVATSDTRAVTDEVIAELRLGTRELLDLLASMFDRFEEAEPLDVLLALSENPIGLLRSSGYDWPGIETYLQQRLAPDADTGLDELDRRLMKHIDLSEWIACADKAAWQWQAAHELVVTPQELERRLQRLDQLRGLRWDVRQGALVFKY
jgi:hypothetical protein